MSYIVRKRHPSQQMQSLFHHSLINMVVMHQLERMGIPWEVFIAHEVFTNPQPHPQQNVPSSSHPLILTPPSPPDEHVSPSTHVPSPQDNPLPSPSPSASRNKESENEQSSDHEGEGNDQSRNNEEEDSKEEEKSDDTNEGEERK